MNPGSEHLPAGRWRIGSVFVQQRGKSATVVVVPETAFLRALPAAVLQCYLAVAKAASERAPSIPFRLEQWIEGDARVFRFYRLRDAADFARALKHLLVLGFAANQ
jgi:hypothetical protein